MDFSDNFSDTADPNRRKSNTPHWIRTSNLRFRRPWLWPSFIVLGDALSALSLAGYDNAPGRRTEVSFSRF